MLFSVVLGSTVSVWNTKKYKVTFIPHHEILIGHLVVKLKLMTGYIEEFKASTLTVDYAVDLGKAKAT